MPGSNFTDAELLDLAQTALPYSTIPELTDAWIVEQWFLNHGWRPEDGLRARVEAALESAGRGHHPSRRAIRAALDYPASPNWRGDPPTADYNVGADMDTRQDLAELATRVADVIHPQESGRRSPEDT